MKLGIDIGSVTSKAVVIDDSNTILFSRYVRTKGRPVETTLTILEEIFSRYSIGEFTSAAATGTGGRLMAEILGISFINEIIAQAAGITLFHPEVRTILEIGGEDSKLILLERESPGILPRVTDFAMNGVCAAGTGSFLDQQASRMGIPVEEFGDVALKSVQPPRVAGRCSVFAKTDMIHLQQVGTPVHDIIAGLCFAMVRNFKGNVVGGRELQRPISFQGGVAFNKGIRKAIQEVLEIPEQELIVPEHFAVMGAIGAAVFASNGTNGTGGLPLDALARIKQYISQREYKFATLPPLQGDNYSINLQTVRPNGAEKTEIYVGVDVGSISTNVVVIDKNNNVLSRRYLMTASKPIQAVQQGLYEVWQELGDSVIVKGTGSTGSGRYMTGEFFGADVIRNEITSHAKAATFLCPEVDTIFEIGGQDAKYISLKNGTIVDFAMNKVCAAGTGSFLEEQAEKLGVKIDAEFGVLGLSSKQPLDLGERCTVFMESQLNYHKQKGATREDLLGGLAYSVVKNYITKVVEDRAIGNHILFQGGVAFNRAVKAAFEAVLGKKVEVPPHHDVLGAIGVAMLAKEDIEATGKKTRFHGFDLRSRRYELSTFECEGCSNHCEIHKVVFEGEVPLFYGSRCGKYDSKEKKEKRTTSLIPRLFDERSEALMKAYPKDIPDSSNSKTVGIPRVLFFHELYPLWKGFFTELGFQVIVSDTTSRSIIRRGVENVIEEPCLPIKLAHGHILNLLEKKPDFLFMPVQCTMERLTGNFPKFWNCPLTQSLPFIVRSSKRINEILDANTGQTPVVLSPVIHADMGRRKQANSLKKIARAIGIKSDALIDKAIQAGFDALDYFNRWQKKRGAEILSQLKPDEKVVVIVGRVYNTCDPGMTLNLPEKLRDLNILAMPIDFLPLEKYAEEVSEAHPNMYWKAGQKILCAARMIAQTPQLFGLYVTNFACGPDSYLLKFFSKEMEGKPFLTIEIDEHSADAGLVTRCEAFVDTIKSARPLGTSQSIAMISLNNSDANRRHIYVPYMIDHGFILAAAARYFGVDAEALPLSDEITLETGRQYTSGKECFPSIVTAGDIVKRTRIADFDPSKAAFLMPAASGPCRFGQYNKLHRMILDDIGLQNVPILVLDQTKNYYQHIAALGRGFKLRMWRGICILDSMYKLVLQTRPYEVNKGETDALYQEMLGLLVGAVERNKDGFVPFARQVSDEFKKIKTDKSIIKPHIGIVGEIFVRSNQFANSFVVRRLEAMGAECALPPFEEWLDYIDYQRRRRSRLHIDGGWKDWTKQKLSEIVQERTAEPIRRQFDSTIECFARESSTLETLNYGRSYLSPAIEGEAILSMGRVIEYAKHGFDGILNVIPFGCMPGTIVSMLLHRFRQDYGLPVFNLVVDGTKDLSQDIRLEAFLQQCFEHVQKKHKTMALDSGR